ncbi:MAG: DUF3604 domain-containing protein [Gammaproteobacteria bacterium]|nr:DUF3604 domain-containing protein [Gammaproteobacteria bacterium]
MRLLSLLVCMLCVSSVYAAKNAYFGDLHVHTRYSFDAFMFGTKTSPDDAYLFARGEAIKHGAGFDIQLDRPLDFYAVTDHAFFLGMWWAMTDPSHPLANDPEARKFLDATTPQERSIGFRTGYPFLIRNFNVADVRTAWEDIQAAAERHNDPGNFTTFIGYEYTSARDGNLHHNVIYRGSEAPPLPFSRLDSLNPEKLWDWMDEQRANGIEALAIPHNSNGSNGNMFDLVKFAGAPLDAGYAEQRMRNEPLVEITQVKGTSDTHPFLSPNDEWADFEIFPYQIASWNKSRPQGSYLRDAWLNGLALEAEQGFNPYRFGVIGSSDTHNSGERFDESTFVSKVGVLDSDAVNRGSVPVEAQDGITGYREVYNRFFGASGLAGVWADENTRESIYDAFRNKETFGTTGPRIKVRFFAGFELDDDALSTPDKAELAYRDAVPQGGDLPARRRGAPRFVAWAVADPMGTRLQRLQIVKGWLEDGQRREKVIDVACSDGLEVDPGTHRCPDNGAGVDITDCSITDAVGASELSTVWTDPDYDPAQRSFYYVRVLENPTCRWSTWDAIRAGTTPRPDLPTTIQERGWSSPIWMTPRT